MAILSQIARGKKLEYFFSKIPKNARILEVGCAGGWVGEWALQRGWKNFVGIDVVDVGRQFDHEFIHGDVNQWRQLGLEAASFDVIIAFEVVEHGDFYDALHDLLKPGGKLFVTTPVPHMDWLCKLFETLHLNQKRTSPHSHLIEMKDVPRFKLERRQVKALMSQWGELVRAD